MALMPEDIQSKTFKEKYKGYDVDEVDEFLDQLRPARGEQPLAGTRRLSGVGRWRAE